MSSSSSSISDNPLFDKIGKILLRDKDSELKDKKKEIMLPTGIDEQGMKDWVGRVVESLSKVNPDEEKRKTGREGKEFICPINYAPIEGVSRIDKEGTIMERPDIDVAEIIFNEIHNHGRQTPDELQKHLEGIDPYLLTFVVNAMVMDDYLDVFIEEDGLKTYELVDILSRNNRLESRNPTLANINEESRFYIEQLPPATAAYVIPKPKPVKSKSKQSVLDKIKIINSRLHDIPTKIVDDSLE